MALIQARRKLTRDKAMSYGSDMLPNLVRKIKELRPPRSFR